MLWIAAVWLLDPIPANISTRGSAESVLGAMVIGTLALAMNGHWDAAAIGLGLAAHFKIYPIIYAASMVVLVGPDDRKYFSRFQRVTSWILDRARVRLTLISAGTFLILNALMYAVYVDIGCVWILVLMGDPGGVTRFCNTHGCITCLESTIDTISLLISTLFISRLRSFRTR